MKPFALALDKPSILLNRAHIIYYGDLKLALRLAYTSRPLKSPEKLLSESFGMQFEVDPDSARRYNYQQARRQFLTFNFK